MKRRTFFKALAGVAVSLSAIYGERFKVAELHVSSTDEPCQVMFNGQPVAMADGLDSPPNAQWISLYDGTRKVFIPVWT